MSSSQLYRFLLPTPNTFEYYPENDKTPVDHITRQRQNIPFTKPKSIPLVNVDSTLHHKVKEQDMYIKIVDMKNTLYIDQTERFSLTSQSGNQYIMVMVKVDSNAILVEPMSSRKDVEM